MNTNYDFLIYARRGEVVKTYGVEVNLNAVLSLRNNFYKENCAPVRKNSAIGSRFTRSPLFLSENGTFYAVVSEQKPLDEESALFSTKPRVGNFNRNEEAVMLETAYYQVNALAENLVLKNLQSPYDNPRLTSEYERRKIAFNFEQMNRTYGALPKIKDSMWLAGIVNYSPKNRAEADLKAQFLDMLKFTDLEAQMPNRLFVDMNKYIDSNWADFFTEHALNCVLRSRGKMGQIQNVLCGWKRDSLSNFDKTKTDAFRGFMFDCLDANGSITTNAKVIEATEPDITEMHHVC